MPRRSGRWRSRSRVCDCEEAARTVRIGSALFNADHTRLGEEVRRVEAAGVEFVHFDVFDGYFVPDQGFAARTIAALGPLTRLPFEVHVAATEPVRFLPARARGGGNLVFLPAESTGSALGVDPTPCASRVCVSGRGEGLGEG